jgi:hypothetical protein
MENRLQAVPSVHDMIDGTAVLDPRSPWHSRKMPGSSIYVNREELTPFLPFSAKFISERLDLERAEGQNLAA